MFGPVNVPGVSYEELQAAAEAAAKIAEAAATTAEASGVTFDDGKNLQEKYDDGELGSDIAWADAPPLMDGEATVGVEEKAAREDHVHPTDTSRAPKKHSSEKADYGVGSKTDYGHVKLSDTLSSGANATAGMAATPAMVYDVNAGLDMKLRKMGVWYGTCDTAADVAEKEVTVADGFTLEEGVRVCVAFSHGHTAQSMKLKINGGEATNAYATIADLPVQIPDDLFYSHDTVDFIYRDGFWRIVNGMFVRYRIPTCNRRYYGTSDSDGADGEWAVTIAEQTGLRPLASGVMISVKFASAQNGGQAKLNVNYTGPKSVAYWTGNLENIQWRAGEIVNFVFDAEADQWIMQRYHSGY